MPREYKVPAPCPEFESWYALYPKKLARGDARKAWEQTAPIRPPLADMLEALRKQIASANWAEEGGRWIPMPASYLRAERWDDADSIVMPEPAKKPDRYDLANQEFERKYGGLTVAK